MKEKIIEIETVHQCNSCMGCKTFHPLASVIDLSKADWKQHTVRFEFYTVLLMEGEVEDFLYGRKYYDYSNASVVFLMPGESIQIDKSKLLFRKGWLLAFHPDLFHPTSLGENLQSYTFFRYGLNEALHLSLREKTKAVACLTNIEEELQHAIDCHSKTLISRSIELFLDYCSRYYERQFITRGEANKEIVNKTDSLLDHSIRSGRLKNSLPPSEAYCASVFHLSPAYFNDLLKFETGKTLPEYFQFKRLEIAKEMLLDATNTPHHVAKELGFANLQCFNRLFKKVTGIAPNEYRMAHN